MPMGIVSDKEFEVAVEDTTHPAPKPIIGTVTIMPRGRGEGNVEVPDSLRKIIGETSAIDGRADALDLANRFGISNSSVSAYAQGATSTSTMDRQPNAPHIADSKERVIRKARGKMMRAMHHITEDKLVGAKAVDLAGIARNMAAVIKTMEPDTPPPGQGGINNNGPTFIFYAPKFRDENTFDVVHAKE